MYNKFTFGVLAAVFALLIWACGSGSVDPVEDAEIVMVGKYNPTQQDIYEALADCMADPVCKAEYEETAKKFPYVPKDTAGKDSIQSSGDNGDVSSSSKGLFDKVSSSSAQLGDEEYKAEALSCAAASSSSKANNNNSSSSEFVYSAAGSSSSIASSVSRAERSSSSKTVIDVEEIDSSSSEEVTDPSSSSRPTSGDNPFNPSTGGGGDVGPQCTEAISGKCTADKDEVYVGQNVTYTFMPDAGNKCDIPENIVWYTFDPGAPSPTHSGGYTLTIAYSKIGNKQGAAFEMGGRRMACADVEVLNCPAKNTYSCTTNLKSSSNDLTKVSSVEYQWDVVVRGCNDVTSYSWSGAVSGSTASVTKAFNVGGKYSAKVTVKDADGSYDVTCGEAAVFPQEIVKKNSPITVANNEKILVSGDALSGSYLACKHGQYQNGSCSISIVGSETVAVTNYGNCGLWNFGDGNLKLPLSKLKDNMATIVLQNVENGVVECQVQ